MSDKLFTPNGGSKPITTKAPKKERPDPNNIFNAQAEQQKKLDPRSGKVKSWSFSALSIFEKCPRQTFLAKIEHIPQGSSDALDRGNRIHAAIEHYIIGETDTLSNEVKNFTSLINALRNEYAKGSVIIEDEWAYNQHWENTAYRSDQAWCRMKLDAMRNESPTSAHIIDWKSGRKFGNEFKHGQQGQLYAIGAFLLYPKLQHITVEFVYVDQAETLEKAYTRDEALLFLPSWTKRATKMTTENDFMPRPAISTCKWCPYREEHCQWSQQ